MSIIRYIIQKEFIQIFRNKTMLPIIFVLPIVQLLVLVFAATFEMVQINMLVVDQDLSSKSRQLIGKFEGSSFFSVKHNTFSLAEAENMIKANNADMIINIPSGFEKDLIKENTGQIQLLINAINSTAAGLTRVYAHSVIGEFNKEVIIENINIKSLQPQASIDVEYSFWYNPRMNYKIYMLPGILVILLTLIGMFLTALNLVREKEMGTIEQINVTPIKKYQFIIGKLFPFWCIALFELAFGLSIGKIVFSIPMIGSLPLLFAFASVYLLVVLGVGLFISTLSSNQQQVMFVAFFVMIVLVMMSGIFTPTESMPVWAQRINIVNPIAHFMKVIRMILLKGSDFFDIWKSFVSLFIYAVGIISLAIWKYRKVA
ncbi:MAG: ABC transporter permease [Bacteroidetes bacterium]|nr:ABC transporter permease [Bacteroidota bacterium]